jgi:Protein of unknown function (DUF3617)
VQTGQIIKLGSGMLTPRLKKRHFCVGVATALVVACAWAQTQGKPGLWEVSSKVAMNGQAMPDMQTMLKNMPPEQRQQMEAALAKQGIVPGGGGKPGYTTMRMCFTAEHLRQGTLGYAPKPDCQHRSEPAAANEMKFSFTCANPKSEGLAQVTWINETLFANSLHMRREHQGKMVQTAMQGSGKWLGADCGEVKPLALPNAAK